MFTFNIHKIPQVDWCLLVWPVQVNVPKQRFWTPPLRTIFRMNMIWTISKVYDGRKDDLWLILRLNRFKDVGQDSWSSAWRRWSRKTLHLGRPKNVRADEQQTPKLRTLWRTPDGTRHPCGSMTMHWILWAGHFVNGSVVQVVQGSGSTMLYWVYYEVAQNLHNYTHTAESNHLLWTGTLKFY
jgi:hypothetical protein